MNHYSIELDGHPALIVEAADKLEASRKAARAWNVEWRKTAGVMVISPLGKEKET